MWQHNYEPLSGGLGLSALVAAIPILVLFVMLGALRRPAWMSALAALVSAFAVALGVYGMPAKLAVISTIFGAAFGIFPIAWIVFAAIMLYRLAVDTGKFEIIKDSVGGLSQDRRLQAMFIAFSFGAFIEGAAGFGAPVAVSGAMLAGLGFNPFYAAGICLLANTAPVAFGSIGIPVTTLANITGHDAREHHRAAGLCAERDGRPPLRDGFCVHSRLLNRRHGGMEASRRGTPCHHCVRSLVCGDAVFRFELCRARVDGHRQFFDLHRGDGAGHEAMGAAQSDASGGRQPDDRGLVTGRSGAGPRPCSGSRCGTDTFGR
jgi:hypothetical protein